ncbi:unnamed protein product [Penicillium camemberti]|uniref:Str. FM013 n=1 Tax=Penicillium camemberti (strain FM 013) TaxID=1429867 RepID=A0A0G4PWT2_PENC3|nr:unnamed protein product [Penicillium camemberti]
MCQYTLDAAYPSPAAPPEVALHSPGFIEWLPVAWPNAHLSSSSASPVPLHPVGENSKSQLGHVGQ